MNFPNRPFFLSDHYKEELAKENFSHYARLLFLAQGLPEDQEDFWIYENEEFILKIAKQKVFFDLIQEIQNFENPDL